VSIINPNMYFSVSATINGTAVVFLIDSGSALTILHKDMWENCKESGQVMESEEACGCCGYLLK